MRKYLWNKKVKRSKKKNKTKINNNYKNMLMSQLENEVNLKILLLIKVNMLNSRKNMITQ